MPPLTFATIAREARVMGKAIDRAELSRINTGTRALLPHHADTLCRILGSRGLDVSPQELIRQMDAFARQLSAQVQEVA